MDGLSNNSDSGSVSVLDTYGVYIYGGCTLLLSLIIVASIVFCVIKRKHDEKKMQSIHGDVEFEDDGYDYIGQLDTIQKCVRDVAVDGNQGDDLNVIKVTQNPYYEESFQLTSHDEPKSRVQTGATTNEHITKLENPYYEGI